MFLAVANAERAQAQRSGSKISISDEERRKIQIFIRNMQSTTTKYIPEHS
jgi:hypothetical protein